MSENKICKTTVTDEGVTLDFTDGTSVSCQLSDLPESVVSQSALFGLRRKLTNSFADAKGNVAEAVKSAQETLQQLMNGLWTAPRERAETGGSRTSSDLLEALIEITGKDAEVVAEKLDAMSKEDKAALRKNPSVAAKLAQIRADRLREKAGEISPEDLFD